MVRVLNNNPWIFSADKVTPKAALLAMLKADRQQKYPIFDKAIEINSVTVKDGIAL